MNFELSESGNWLTLLPISVLKKGLGGLESEAILCKTVGKIGLALGGLSGARRLGSFFLYFFLITLYIEILLILYNRWVVYQLKFRDAKDKYLTLLYFLIFLLFSILCCFKL